MCVEYHEPIARVNVALHMCMYIYIPCTSCPAQLSSIGRGVQGQGASSGSSVQSRGFNITLHMCILDGILLLPIKPSRSASSHVCRGAGWSIQYHSASSQLNCYFRQCMILLLLIIWVRYMKVSFK